VKWNVYLVLNRRICLDLNWSICLVLNRRICLDLNWRIYLVLNRRICLDLNWSIHLVLNRRIYVDLNWRIYVDLNWRIYLVLNWRICQILRSRFLPVRQHFEMNTWPRNMSCIHLISLRYIVACRWPTSCIEPWRILLPGDHTSVVSTQHSVVYLVPWNWMSHCIMVSLHGNPQRLLPTMRFGGIYLQHL
jgi:hypothetical protein